MEIRLNPHVENAVCAVCDYIIPHNTQLDAVCQLRFDPSQDTHQWLPQSMHAFKLRQLQSCVLPNKVQELMHGTVSMGFSSCKFFLEDKNGSR